MLKAFGEAPLFGGVYGQAPPWVLALHGWRRTHRDFDQVLDGIDAVGLDLPGFGGATPSPPEPWGAAEYAAAVSSVLEQLVADAGGRLVVLGHSYGGRVAAHLASGRPDLVRALVLTGVPLLRPPGAPRRPAFAFRVARAMHRAGLVSEERLEASKQRHGSADYRAATGVMRDVLVRAVSETYEEQLAAIACPVELVWGADDDQAPVTVATEAQRRLACARLTVCPGVGHMTPTDCPAALRAALERHRLAP